MNKICKICIPNIEDMNHANSSWVIRSHHQFKSVCPIESNRTFVHHFVFVDSESRQIKHHHGCCQKFDINEMRLHAHVSKILVNVCCRCCALSLPQSRTCHGDFGRDRISRLRRSVSYFKTSFARTKNPASLYLLPVDGYARDGVTTDSFSRSPRHMVRSTPPRGLSFHNEGRPVREGTRSKELIGRRLASLCTIQR